jgi:hypothetical protein
MSEFDRTEIVPQPAGQMPHSLLWSVPWYHHVALMEKVKDLPARPCMSLRDQLHRERLSRLLSVTTSRFERMCIRRQ